MITDLDDQLTSLAAPMPEAAQAEAHRMARETMPRRLQNRRAPRARWVLPIVVGGAVVLTAGAGTATIVMSHWGGVEMPLGNIRNTEPIPVSWTTESGHTESCRAWIEIRTPQPGDQAALNRAVAARDWSGIGQRLYDGAAAPSGDHDGESRVGEALDPVLRDFADKVFPGIPWIEAAADTSVRTVDAWGMTCAPEAP